VTAVHLANDRGLLPRLDEEVRRVEAAGYDGVWFGEVTNLDGVVPAALAAQATEGIQNFELSGVGQERLLVVLAMNIDERTSELFQDMDGTQDSVQVHSVSS